MESNAAQGEILRKSDVRGIKIEYVRYLTSHRFWSQMVGMVDSYFRIFQLQRIESSHSALPVLKESYLGNDEQIIRAVS